MWGRLENIWFLLLTLYWNNQMGSHLWEEVLKFSHNFPFKGSRGAGGATGSPRPTGTVCECCRESNLIKSSVYCCLSPLSSPKGLPGELGFSGKPGEPGKAVSAGSSSKWEPEKDLSVKNGERLNPDILFSCDPWRAFLVKMVWMVCLEMTGPRSVQLSGSDWSLWVSLLVSDYWPSLFVEKPSSRLSLDRRWSVVEGSGGACLGGEDFLIVACVSEGAAGRAGGRRLPWQTWTKGTTSLRSCSCA